jgi:hypothetical protein
MMGDIDFSKGGYQGGFDEELFKFFTQSYMEYWWFFREVLRASDRVAQYWKYSSGKLLRDDDQKELVGLSLQNYAVHTGIAEALTYFDEMVSELNRILSPMRRFEVRRLWKATYSSLYTSFNALCNIVYVLGNQVSVFGKKKGKIWNYTPAEVLDFTRKSNLVNIYTALENVKQSLVIRDHLDHYWTIWVSIDQGQFLMDSNFTAKGHLLLYPEKELQASEDALNRAHKDIIEIASQYNIVYRELCIPGTGLLDNYLQHKNWIIDYSNYQPHNGRPVTKS